MIGENVDISNSVTITFHIPVNLSTSFSQIKIEDSLSDLFYHHKRIHINGSSDKQLSYSIRKPILDSSAETAEFFRSLKRLFIRTAQFTPHFSQPSEKDGISNGTSTV